MDDDDEQWTSSDRTGPMAACGCGPHRSTALNGHPFNGQKRCHITVLISLQLDYLLINSQTPTFVSKYL